MLYIHVHISSSMTNKSGLTFFLSIKYMSVCHGYLYVTHIQPRAAHDALHHITPGHWTCLIMDIYMSHISILELIMVPYIILPLVTGPVHSYIFICHTYPA